MSMWDQYVYSYVPKSALEDILTEGLYGGEALIKRPDLLESAAKGRGLSAKEFKKNIEENLKSWSKDSSKGPNIIFHLIPDSQKLSKKHPTKKYKLIPIKINLTELLADFPETKIYGMELKPYSDTVTIKERSHFLNVKEIDEFLIMSPKEMWSRYNDIEDRGLYAPDVPHASIHCNNGIIPSKYIQKVNKKSEIINSMNILRYADEPHLDESYLKDLKIIDRARKVVKKSDSVREIFQKYDLNIDEIDDIPVCFADIDVSARTEKGIIYLNESFRDKEKDIPNYLAHEMTHYAQQTTGDGPTKGSTDDTYLDNEYEQEGFRVQTKYLSETEGDTVAKKYIDKVLRYHEVPKSEKKEKQQQLLQLASNQTQLFDRLNKSKEELLDEYDTAVAAGPQARHERKGVMRTMMSGSQSDYVKGQLQNILRILDTVPISPVYRKKLERKKEMLQLTLGLDE